MCLFFSFSSFFVFIKVGVMAEAEMEEVARKDFQEEPGMMERSTHLFFVLLVKDVIVVIIVVVMFAFLSAISELSAWISSTPHLAQVSLSLSHKKSQRQR